MTPRLYLDIALRAGETVALDAAQSHYLVDVLRLRPGAAVRPFNGRDGEYEATLQPRGRRAVGLDLSACVRRPEPGADLWLLAAPIKRDRIDWLVEKATELGVARILPVATERAVVDRLNLDRLNAHAREAAEQCERLDLPPIDPLRPLAAVLAALEDERLVLFCDERGEAPMLSAAAAGVAGVARPLALLVGPEGGFSPGERHAIRAHPNTLAVSLGPRILRAETAAIAALAIVQATLGDWTFVRSRL